MKKVVIIGDSTHNTLSAVRSFGEGGIDQTLLLVCHEDNCFVRYSKYLKHGNLYVLNELDACLPVLEQLASEKGQMLMTTFDAAAEWVDHREKLLSQWFLTPCRGKQIGRLFNKEAQCELAKACGLTVPFSVVYHRGDVLPVDLPYPVITKPLVSSEGEKSDIHICQNFQELKIAMNENNHSNRFLIQQFIKKEFEINCLGVRTENGTYIAGGIKKIRHWPKITGAASFAVIRPDTEYNINIDGIKQFLNAAGFHGTFSVEFLHTKEGRNYFMEVNFRNDGLAYTSTCAGANLHALYADSTKQINWDKFRPTYMMNYSIDLLYVKEGDITWLQWLKDFLKTRCFINICFSDLGPVLAYYKRKLKL